MARRLGRRTSNPKDRGHDDVRCRSPIRYNPSVAVPAARPIRDSGPQIKLDEGKINDCLHLWIGYGVANHVVSAGPQSGFRLVLLALQTSRNLFVYQDGAASFTPRTAVLPFGPVTRRGSFLAGSASPPA